MSSSSEDSDNIIDKTSFICNICHKTFSKKNYLSKHKKIHSNEKVYKCNICEKKFIELSTLRRHRRVHSGEKPYKCLTCNKTFSDQGNLARHKRIHVASGPFTCNICDNIFITRSNLSNHMRIHNGEKINLNTDNKPTQNFEENTYSEDSFEDHDESLDESTQKQERPYVCNTCGQAFRLQASLKIHMKIHTGKKAYKCNICDKKFRDWNGLKLHGRIHVEEKEEKSYSCDKCDESFRLETSLKIHYRIHKQMDSCNVSKKNNNRNSIQKTVYVGDRTYKCDICDNTFTGQSNLTNHMRIHS